MNVNEAYDEVREAVDELAKGGIDVAIRPAAGRNNPETVAKYKGPEYLLPEKWVSVRFHVATIAQSELISDRQQEFMALGVYFDTGGGMGLREWELDWSFHLRERKKY